MISSKLTTNHDLRRLRAEIVSALRCSELLDQIGVRFAFRPGKGAVGVEIEVCGEGGEPLCSIAPRQLLQLLEGGPTDYEAWLLLVGAIDLDGAERR